MSSTSFSRRCLLGLVIFACFVSIFASSTQDNQSRQLSSVESADNATNSALKQNSNGTAAKANDDSLFDTLNNPDNKGIIVRSLFVLAGLTVIVVIFFIVKIALLRLKQRRRRRYTTADRIEMQRLEDEEDDDDDVEIFDQSKTRNSHASPGKTHRNGSLR